MTLTMKQRAKINAALCMIHDNGHDASAVTAAARAKIARGTDARTAYEQALNSFADNNPDLLSGLSRIVNLVQASDDATVAQYDAALSSYIESGDESAMRALTPMIDQDMAALAARNGEAPPEFSEDFQAAVAAAPQVKLETNTFAFSVKPATDTVADRRVVNTDSHISLSGSATGMVAPKAARQYSSPTNQPVNGLPISTRPVRLSLPGATVTSPEGAA